MIAAIYYEPHADCPSPSFSLLTCDSNEIIYPINDRMPVILTNKAMEMWLDPKSTVEDLKALFGAWPSDGFTVTDGGSMLREKKPNPPKPDAQGSTQTAPLFED
jgi:putative SOS response-associated peptidase YedK